MKYYYGKRFRLDDAQAKVQSFLGEDADSRIAVLSDRAEATFRITFADENKAPLEILMAEFIDEKSAKAKGKRVTTLEVASIEDITPEPEPEPEEPEEEEESLEDAPLQEGEETQAEETSEEPQAPNQPETLDIDGVPMTIEKPADTQLDLF